MPTFDFQCSTCDHVFEFNRPFGSIEIPPCPVCDSAKTKKLIAAPTIAFKGEGFYKTDSQKKPEIKPAAPKEEKKQDTPPPEKAPEPKPEQKDSKKEPK
ncbi:FmdB family transcriptional regulator [Candidatus Peregrinibacteria bacterium CG10_big_fil_rev_8_21_14_0_10_49_24]|nr:MAG: FmdB family transcriptional regulator [Candidatus Peregrinibacteria bacterium CG11_big_fil_rev_8_21_14_0_20_49_14]PIR50882.1 MAG: FmdB family transcriptional regulator [Candidatus Peregrinibacteria bacterium CG10_big_fil_rev_8_21_14_0_10_49_24]PJA67159.1 MAG: FmdB family transcriptional regulator [Candidatus Peregrinibacteria bacterium CG_4_9_14_3_um_filter_49_12]